MHARTHTRTHARTHTHTGRYPVPCTQEGVEEAGAPAPPENIFNKR